MDNPLKPVAQASELITDSVVFEGGVCECGAEIAKTVFADGDTYECSSCSRSVWFELRGTEVYVHQTDQSISGESLGKLLSKRSGGSDLTTLLTAAMMFKVFRF